MNTNPTFFRKLYSQSRPGFVIAGLFVIFYAFFFFKMMDMTVFAYNGMFVRKASEKQATAYALKINNKILPTSHKLWWKKDFLESSLIGFSEYLEREQSTYLQHYLSQKMDNPIAKQFFLSRLTAQDVDALAFVRQYALKAGYIVQPADKLEIARYQLHFGADGVQITDSSIIYIKTSK
jgi:hypothetical protein